LVYPQYLMVMTTYRCNSRCQHCGIWKGDLESADRCELDPREFAGSALVANARHVSLAGGEPTVSPFFWGLLDHLPLDIELFITTNALAGTKRLLREVTGVRRRNTTVFASLDGMETTCDRLRGVRGAFRKAVDLLESLRDGGVKRGVSFTISRENYRELEACYDLARELDAAFDTRAIHFGGMFGNQEGGRRLQFGEDELDELDEVVDGIVSSELEKPNHVPARVVYLSWIPESLRGRGPKLPCRIMEHSVGVDVYGQLFAACPFFLQHPVGDILNESFESLWAGHQAAKLREKTRSCTGCWLDCQVIPGLQQEVRFLDAEYLKLRVSHLRKRPFPGRVDLDGGEVLLLGWHPVEGEKGARFRWTKGSFSMALPGGTSHIHLLVAPPPLFRVERPDVLTLSVEDQPPIHIEITAPGVGEYSIQLPTPATGLSVCECELDRVVRPCDEGLGGDERELGLAVRRLRFEQE